jgi:hypothetical protein
MNDLRERIFRSTEWFRLAHTEADNVSTLSKVVMMSTAFEIMLQVPNANNKKGSIAEKLDSLCSTSKMHRSTRQSGKSPSEHSDLAWWGYDFYNIRNDIVHGDKVDSERLRYRSGPCGDWLTQLLVADLVFWECVVRLLYKERLIGGDVLELATELDKLFPEPSTEELVEQLASWRWFLGIDDVHEALGWGNQESTDAGDVL